MKEKHVQLVNNIVTVSNMEVWENAFEQEKKSNNKNTTI